MADLTIWTNGSVVGPYVLLESIGEGGMGEVWKARDTRLDRIVAIKRLKGQHSTQLRAGSSCDCGVESSTYLPDLRYWSRLSCAGVPGWRPRQGSLAGRRGCAS